MADAALGPLMLAPGGALAARVVRGGVRLYPRDGVPVELAVAASAFACVDGELWAVAGGSECELARYDATGALIETVAIGAVAESTAVACSQSATLLFRGKDGREVHRAGRAGLAVSAVATCDDAIPLAPRTRLDRRDRGLCLRRGGAEVAIMVAPDVASRSMIVNAAMVFASTAIAIELRGTNSHQIVVADARHGSMLARLRLEGVDAAWLVPGREHLILRRGDHLAAIDLRTRHGVGEHVLEAGAVIAIDPRGEAIAIAGGDDAVCFIPYHEAFGPRAKRITGGHEVVEPAADEDASPEPTVDVEPEASIIEAAPLEESPPANTVVEPEPSPAPLAHERLAALGEQTVREALSASEQGELLADLFALVSAWCRRALAEGWDSGRITSERGELPFAIEAAAILDGASGRATPQLIAAIAAEDEATSRFARWSTASAPHVELARELGLTPTAVMLVLAAAAPQLWPDLARAYALVVNDPARAFCDEHLLAQLLGATAPGAIARELDDDAPLVRHGVVAFGAGARPFRAVTIARPVILRLLGAVAVDDDLVALRTSDRTLDEIRAPRPVLAALVQALRHAGASPARVVIRGRAASGRRTLAAALAAQAGRGLGEIIVDGIEGPQLADALRARLRAASLRGWIPCISGLEHVHLEAAARAAVKAVLDGFAGPLFVRAEPGASLPMAPGAIVADLPVLAHRERVEAWRDAAARYRLDVGVDALDPLAQRFAIGPGAITRVVAHVVREAAADIPAALEAQLRTERAVRLRGVAHKVERLPAWSQIVLPPDTVDGVRALVGRVRHRRRVLEDWGMGEVVSSARGVTALFQGPPGTGKTLVAGAIARELGYDLYRVDLSQVMSKWLGETEKNLAAVFAAAEEGECVLLFDEADSLFARRTEVRSSNDRYANLEVNYLLQRLDEFEGIAILTTNFGTSIDPAFRRRMSVRLTFPFPDDEARLELWRTHLAPGLPVSGDLALPELARRFQLSGGYIRNAVLRAAHLAADQDHPITADTLVRAVRLELAEMGKLADTGAVE
jgi:hypothetical protein